MALLLLRDRLPAEPLARKRLRHADPGQSGDDDPGDDAACRDRLRVRPQEEKDGERLGERQGPDERARDVRACGRAGDQQHAGELVDKRDAHGDERKQRLEHDHGRSTSPVEPRAPQRPRERGPSDH